jgi:hypothetical protein
VANRRGKKSKIREVLCKVQTVECLVCNEGAEDRCAQLTTKADDESALKNAVVAFYIGGSASVSCERDWRSLICSHKIGKRETS